MKLITTKLSYVLIALFMLPVLIPTAATLPLPPPIPRRNIFILAGQSNMAGRGGVHHQIWDGVVPTEAHPNPLILRFNKDLEWEEAQEPLHADIDVNKTCGIGPGLAFANRVLEREPTFGPMGLVPCAIGGTKISQWAKGIRLYHEMLRRAQSAIQGGGAIVGLLWFQGEADTVRLDDAALYKMRFEKFIHDIREDLQSPTLPIFQVALVSGQGPFLKIVRDGQLKVNLPNVVTVDARDLSLEPDMLHLTTESAVRIGENLADVFLRTYTRAAINDDSLSLELLTFVARSWIVLGSIILILALHRRLG